MLNVDSIWLIIFSDLFVNLSAGWFGAALIAPFASKRPKVRWRVLPLNISFAMISLIGAYLLKKIAGL